MTDPETKAGTPHLDRVTANWAVPATFNAYTTTRRGGISEAPFASLNLGAHVGDHPDHVAENRRAVSSALSLPAEPVWLEQVHGTRVAEVARQTVGTALTADASVTRDHGCVLAVMTADCLPVVLCSPEYHVIAAVHAGWRGLAADILQHTVLAMDCPPRSIHAWLGPAIGPEHFEVGDEVWDQFVAEDWKMAECFSATKKQTFMADIYAIARRSLSTLGVAHISGGDHCTYSDAERFYSYRRDTDTGRMVTLAWMAP